MKGKSKLRVRGWQNSKITFKTVMNPTLLTRANLYITILGRIAMLSSTKTTKRITLPQDVMIDALTHLSYENLNYVFFNY